MSQRLSSLLLPCNPSIIQRRRSVLPPFASATSIASYHDYTRFQTNGKHFVLPSAEQHSFVGGAGRIPLLIPKLIGLVDSRGNRAYASALGSPTLMCSQPGSLPLPPTITSRTFTVLLHYLSIPKNLNAPSEQSPVRAGSIRPSRLHRASSPFYRVVGRTRGSTASQSCMQEFHAPQHVNGG